MLIKYFQSLKQNIDNRFQAPLPVVTGFSVFVRLALPPREYASFGGHGSSQVEILGAHFYVTQTDREKFQVEWKSFKFELVDEWKSKDEFKAAAKTTTPTEWVLHCLITMKETHSQVYPMLNRIAEVCTIMPVSNASPERGVSALRRVKRRIGSRIKNYLLEALMQVSINGPAVSSKEESQIVDRAVKRWNQVLRRRLPKVRRSTLTHVTSVTTSDAQVNEKSLKLV